MTILQYAAVYGLSLLTFLAVDGVWLGLVARNLYRDNLGHLMAAKPSWGPAVIFYLIYVAGVLLFAVYPGLDKGSLGKAVVLGAIFGCLAYATYDLTNAATLKNWPLKITIIDIIWGSLLTGLVAGVGYLVAQWVR